MPSNFVARGPEAYDSYMGRWSKRLASGFLEFVDRLIVVDRFVDGSPHMGSVAVQTGFTRRPLVNRPPDWLQPHLAQEIRGAPLVDSNSCYWLSAGFGTATVHVAGALRGLKKISGASR